MTMRDLALYRPNVGLALFHADGRVFLGRRTDTPDPYVWQMPQGGIDEGETPREAAFRELYEEAGVAPEKAHLLEEAEDWIYYDFPPEVRARLASRRDWLGQRQKWFALRFLGEDGDVHLGGAEPEFCEWRWARLEETPSLIVPFKRGVYEEVARRFKRYAGAAG
jgi:putative (di)nucleoside polyphosphate hydrolase